MKIDLLTENEVIDAVINYLKNKGRTEVKKVIHRSDASQKEHGVDIQIKLANEKGNGNNCFIEAKGNKRADGTIMRSTSNTNFRWAISQIILRIKVDSTKNNYIYGIALPNSDIQKAINLIHDNWALKHLKIRLYGAYRNDNDELTAIEYCPEDIYK
jgi:hypothetical protein